MDVMREQHLTKEEVCGGEGVPLGLSFMLQLLKACYKSGNVNSLDLKAPFLRKSHSSYAESQ